jgi:hypothetical protein
MDVRSDKNKNLLSQILESNLLKKQDASRFYNAIDNQVNLIYKERFKFQSNLVNMNKEIIRRFSIIESDIKAKQDNESRNESHNEHRNEHRNESHNNNSEINIQHIKDNRSKKEWREEKKNDFEKRMKEKQDDFRELANPKKPIEIDFRDKEDIGQMRSIDAALLERERELRKVMETYNSDSAAQWIGNDEINKNIKIDPNSNIPLDAEIVQPTNKKTQKRVKFEITESNTETTSFLNKLKMKSNNTKEINAKDELQSVIDMHKNIVVRLENIIKSL